MCSSPLFKYSILVRGYGISLRDCSEPILFIFNVIMVDNGSQEYT